MSSQLVPYWYIFNKKTRSIWKTTYLDKGEAEKEMKKSGLSSDWILEEAQTYREVDGGNSDDFTKF